jgi:hypothetical protein
MAHTFDIRFVRSGGLAGFFEAPANSYRWKGAGKLRIDPEGISIAVRRGILSLLAKRNTQRIPAANLREVYREGEALRVEFASDGNPREVLPFWVQDRDTAAHIVNLLPTTRTVEMEHSTVPREGEQFRIDWRIVSYFAFALLFAAVAALVIDRIQNTTPAPIVAPPAIELPPAVVEVAPDTATLDVETPDSAPESFIESFPANVAPPPALPGTRELDPVYLDLQVPRNSPAYRVARRQVQMFTAQAVSIEKSYRENHKRFTSRAISTDEFLVLLDDSEMRWWDFTFRILEDDALADPALTDVRAALLAAARHWRNFYSGYAEGLRRQDHVMIARSFDELTLAEELRTRVRQHFVN